MFQTHNRDVRPPSLFDRLRTAGTPRLSQPRSLARFSLSAARALRDHVDRRDVADIKTEFPDHVLMCDSSRGYLVTFYAISVDNQIKQLESAGFHSAEAFDLQGTPVTARATYYWGVYFICQRGSPNGWEMSTPAE